jgi:uncharacterized protein YhhL (DUF1145 family)
MEKSHLMKYPLALASAVFFWMPVTYALLLVFPYSGPTLFTTVLIATCALSIAGILLILLSEKFTKPVQRYFIVQLILDLLAVLMSGVLLALIGGSIPRGIPESCWAGWAAGILLLAPCSMAVFYVIPADQRVRSVSIALTAIMCAPATIAMVILVRDFPHGMFESALGMMAIYWIACMPVIGVCYLAMAWDAKDG